MKCFVFLISVCMWGCLGETVCGYTYGKMCVWRSEAIIRYWFLFPSCLRQGLLSSSADARLAGPWDSKVSPGLPSSYHRSTGIVFSFYFVWLYVDSGDPNISPHTWAADTLTTEPSARAQVEQFQQILSTESLCNSPITHSDSGHLNAQDGPLPCRIYVLTASSELFPRFY